MNFLDAIHRERLSVGKDLCAERIESIHDSGNLRINASNAHTDSVAAGPDLVDDNVVATLVARDRQDLPGHVPLGRYRTVEHVAGFQPLDDEAAEAIDSRPVHCCDTCA